MKKCKKYKLFMAAVEDEDEWDDMFDIFSREDLMRIKMANLEFGYQQHDIEDKMDFVNRLPFKLKIKLIEDIENQYKSSQISTEKDKLLSFVNAWKPLDLN